MKYEAILYFCFFVMIALECSIKVIAMLDYVLQMALNWMWIERFLPLNSSLCVDQVHCLQAMIFVNSIELHYSINVVCKQ